MAKKMLTPAEKKAGISMWSSKEWAKRSMAIHIRLAKKHEI
jgi:hypothetical protein